MKKIKKIYRQDKLDTSVSKVYIPVDDGSEELKGKPIEDIGGKGYKEYVALLSQSGTSAPVATVLQNELGEVPVFSRDGTGEYYLTTTGDVFTANKTSVTITNSEGGKTIGGYSDTTKTVYFSQNEDTSTYIDEFESVTMIIRVYE